MKSGGFALNWRGLVCFLKLLLITAVVGGLLWWLLFVSGIFVLKNYQISANEDRKGYFEENFKRFFKGRNTFAVSLEEGEEALRQDTSVKSVAIRRQFPDQLRYDVRFRQAIAVVVRDRMHLFLDEEGYLLRTAPIAVVPYTRIDGLPLDRYVNGKLLESSRRTRLDQALKLAQLLSQAPFGKNAVVDVSGKNLELRLNDGFKGKFSYTASIEDGFNRFASVYEDLLKKGVAKGLIDVSQNGYPVYKPFGE